MELRKILCDVCGKDLANPDGGFTAGMNINIPLATKTGAELKKVFGKADFKICCVCMLKSAGVKSIDGNMAAPRPQNYNVEKDVKRGPGRPKRGGC